jgi:hypothetical protein
MERGLILIKLSREKWGVEAKDNKSVSNKGKSCEKSETFCFGKGGSIILLEVTQA